MVGSNRDLKQMLVTGDIIPHRFFDEKLIVPSEHRLAGEHSVALKDLADEKPERFRFVSLVGDTARMKGIKLETIFQSRDFHTIQGLVGAWH